MGYLKGKSTLIIFERHANLKYKYGNRTFWCRGFYVSTVGNNKTTPIEELTEVLPTITDQKYKKMLEEKCKEWNQENNKT